MKRIGKRIIGVGIGVVLIGSTVYAGGVRYYWTGEDQLKEAETFCAQVTNKLISVNDELSLVTNEKENIILLINDNYQKCGGEGASNYEEQLSWMSSTLESLKQEKEVLGEENLNLNIEIEKFEVGLERIDEALAKIKLTSGNYITNISSNDDRIYNIKLLENKIIELEDTNNELEDTNNELEMTNNTLREKNGYLWEMRQYEGELLAEMESIVQEANIDAEELANTIENCKQELEEHGIHYTEVND